MRPGADLLGTIVSRFHRNPGWASKRPLHWVTEALGATDWVTGPGDDAAVIHTEQGDLLAAGEALYPAFVAADPYGAGIGAVVANVNDIAAMGGRPLAIVDAIVGPEDTARAILAGLRHAADLYRVPVVGGHLTVAERDPSAAAFILGHVSSPLLSRNATPGQIVMLATCLDGRLRKDFPFYPSYEHRGPRLREDLDLLPQVAEREWCTAAKDVSMAGLLGSLAMLLEPTRSGAEIDLERVPRPTGVPLETWLDVFPSYGFLLCGPRAHVDDCVAVFTERDLACSPIGVLDASGSLRVRLGASSRVLLTDTAAASTGLGNAS